MLRKVYGDAEAARLQKLQRDAIANQRTEVYAYDENASLNPKVSGTPPAFINLQRTVLEPGMAGAYAAALAKLKNAEEKAGDKRTIIRRNEIQGGAFVRYQAVLINKLSDRDVQNPNAGDSLRKIYGNAEATQVQETLNKAIRNRTQVFLAYRPDLSKQKPST